MATLYGAGAYTGTNPIGGGPGYISPYGFSQSLAHYIPENLSDLNQVMAEAKPEKLIWIPDGVTIVVPTIANAGARMWLPSPVNTGVFLASNRGLNGAVGGKIKLTATLTGAFATGIWIKSRAILSGLTIEGPGNRGVPGSTSAYTLGALKLSGSVKVEVENCNLLNFSEEIISLDNIKALSGENLYWNSANRHKIHHSEIHGAQAHGWGYGILTSNANGYGIAALVEACKIYDCRHELACDHMETASYEMRYCEIGDGYYWYLNNGAVYYQPPVDAHGSGHSTSGYAGRHYEMHHNTFTNNHGHGGTEAKANCGIRGIPSDKHNFYNNWVKKVNHSAEYPSDGSYEVALGGNAGFVNLSESEGGAWTGENDMPAHKVYVWNNWYGTTAPPDVRKMAVTVSVARR